MDFYTFLLLWGGFFVSILFAFSFGWLQGVRSKRSSLETMIQILEKSEKKRKCDFCKRIFTEEMSKWSSSDLSKTICILCHQKFWKRKTKDYMPHEQKEIKILKEETKSNNRRTK